MRVSLLLSLLGLTAAANHHPLVQSYEPYTDENGVTYTYDEAVQDWYYVEDGVTKYMQNIIDDDDNGFEDFYQYEGQYTEFQRISPGSDLFNQFSGYKPEIEYELGREFTTLYPLEFA